jgi:hypothetical protein
MTFLNEESSNGKFRFRITLHHIVLLYLLHTNSVKINATHVTWILCHYYMVCRSVTCGGDVFHIWRLAASMSDRQARVTEEEWSAVSFTERGTKNSSHNESCSIMSQSALGLGVAVI